MQVELENVLRSLSKSFHFNFTIVEPPFRGLVDFDNGMRRLLIPDYDFSEFGRQLLEKLPLDTFVTTPDEWNCSYTLIKLSAIPDKAYLFGPVVRMVLTDNILDRVQAQYGEAVLQLVRDVYQNQNIVYDTDGRSFIRELFQEAFPKVRFQFAEVKDFLPMPVLHPGYTSRIISSEYDHLQLQEKYRIERLMMDAVSAGDQVAAVKFLEQLERYEMSRQVLPSRTSLKNQCLEINAVCKYCAVSSGNVHPSYLEAIHKELSQQAAQINNIQEMTRLIRKMISAYCECINKFSLEQYSPLIRRALNYIHFNLNSNLTLRSIADVCNANPSYLSKLFHTEIGCTLTKYINQQRIQRSIPLLCYTQMSIAQISESVGFLDENYYARIFKRVIGMPPKAYRQENQM